MARSQQRHGSLNRQIASALVLLFILYTLVTVTTFSRIPSHEDHRVFFEEHAVPTDANHVSQAQRRINNSENANAITNPIKHSGIKLRDIDSISSLQHTFPVHVEDDYEDIQFPAYIYTRAKKDLKLKVPKFWDSKVYGDGGVRTFLGNYGERLITPEEAAQVGSFKDGLKTIYVSIASYRDPECALTVEDMFLRAKHPERIRLAVVDQTKDDDPKCSSPAKPCEEDPEQALCKYRHLMDFFEVDGKFSVGPVFARHLAHRMYRGEYFAMQIDAHVRFIKDWDDDVTKQWESANNEMGVLSAYPSDLSGAINPETHESQHRERPIMCKSDYEGSGVNKHLRHGQQPEGIQLVHGEPMFEPFWAAGFSFARGHFVVQVPYDQFLPMVFQGEEISIGLRGFTHGYDYYTMESAVCFHMYAVKENKAKRKKIKLFWENSGSYSGVAAEAMKRLNGIIGMGRPGDDYYHEDEKKYGLGKVRTTEKFFKTFGIHTDTQTVEQNLCRFVGRPMLKEFKPALRSNRMGLDYDKINYVFVDPEKKQQKRR